MVRLECIILTSYNYSYMVNLSILHVQSIFGIHYHVVRITNTAVWCDKKYEMALSVRGGRYSGYIVIPRYYFEAITVSHKILLSGIIAVC